MKKLLALLLVLTMVLSLAACGKKEAPAPEAEATEPAPTETVDPYADCPSFTFTQYGDAKITIVGAEFIKDDWDEDVLRVYYNYTNTGTSACNHYPGITLNFMSVTQDGQNVARSYFGKNDECAIAEDLVYDSPTQPGCTSRQTMLFNCDPNGGVVEISCYIMVGSWVFEADKVECFTFQIDPKNLMGVPEPLVMPAITNPTYAAGLPTSGTADYPTNCEISIDGWELTKGDAGEDVLRVKLTVTNNGEEEAMPMNITNGVEAYQDGLGLLWFSTWDLDATEEDEAYEEELYPGETVQCNALFLLRNDSPVEIVVESLNNDLRLGMICDVAKEIADQKADAAAKTSEEAKVLVGTWLQRDSDWDDTYIFNADGTGMLISGPEYPFTYSVEGDTLIITYDPDDEEEFTFSVDGDLLTMIDMWDEELLLDKQTTEVPKSEIEPTEATEAPAETEAPAQPQAEGVDWATYLIGTWEDRESGYGETFTFKKDGTGVYSYTDGEVYQYSFTYEICDDDSVDIYYEDGDIGGFYMEMEDEDTMLISNSAVTDMEMVRK